MALKCRIVVESYDDFEDKMQSREDLLNISITRPNTIDEIGLDYKAQIALLKSTLDKIIELQGPLVNEYHNCPRCGKKVSKRGKASCEVHAMNTDHKIEIQKDRCSHCDWTSSESIKVMYGTDVHTSLTKIQAELGSSYAFRKVVSILQTLSLDKKRSINNKERIKRVVTAVGKAIEEYNLSDVEESKDAIGNLIVHVDGAHVNTQEKGKRSFEVMTATIFKPEDVRMVNERERVIEHKAVVASAKEDNQASITKMLINAAKRFGTNSSVTNIVGLSDGASNCKSVIKSLALH